MPELNDDQLRQLCVALGWQGGTFWQVLARVRELSALPAPVRGESEEQWRPIESAPKDGREVILREWGRVGAACWVEWPDTCDSDGAPEGDGGEGWTMGFDGDLWGDPTHWMPMPKAPLAASAPKQAEGGADLPGMARYGAMQAALDALEDNDGQAAAAILRTLMAAPAPAAPKEAQELVSAQANDEGLWFAAQTASEAYLQAALRKLHAAVEADSPSQPQPGWRLVPEEPTKAMIDNAVWYAVPCWRQEVPRIYRLMLSASPQPQTGGGVPVHQISCSGVEAFQQAELDAARAEPKFHLGDVVRKKSGSEWQGTVCGTYSTTLTPEGYAVESDAHRGSVQIYPAGALELVRTADGVEVPRG